MDYPVFVEMIPTLDAEDCPKLKKWAEQKAEHSLFQKMLIFFGKEDSEQALLDLLQFEIHFCQNSGYRIPFQKDNPVMDALAVKQALSLITFEEVDEGLWRFIQLYQLFKEFPGVFKKAKRCIKKLHVEENWEKVVVARACSESNAWGLVLAAKIARRFLGPYNVADLFDAIKNNPWQTIRNARLSNQAFEKWGIRSEEDRLFFFAMMMKKGRVSLQLEPFVGIVSPRCLGSLVAIDPVHYPVILEEAQKGGEQKFLEKAIDALRFIPAVDAPMIRSIFSLKGFWQIEAFHELMRLIPSALIDAWLTQRIEELLKSTGYNTVILNMKTGVLEAPACFCRTVIVDGKIDHDRLAKILASKESDFLLRLEVAGGDTTRAREVLLEWKSLSMLNK